VLRPRTTVADAAASSSDLLLPVLVPCVDVRLTFVLVCKLHLVSCALCVVH
jgi:hypothetical protein